MKTELEITLDPGEIVAAGESTNPVRPRTWLRFGLTGTCVLLTFQGPDAPLAEKLAQTIESHRAMLAASKGE